MSALKTRIARQHKAPHPARPVPVSGAIVPAAVQSPAFQYAAGPGGAELRPLSPIITADGAIIPGAGPGTGGPVIPAGRR